MKLSKFHSLATIYSSRTEVALNCHESSNPEAKSLFKISLTGETGESIGSSIAFQFDCKGPTVT